MSNFSLPAGGGGNDKNFGENFDWERGMGKKA